VKTNLQVRKFIGESLSVVEEFLRGANDLRILMADDFNERVERDSTVEIQIDDRLV